MTVCQLSVSAWLIGKQASASVLKRTPASFLRVEDKSSLLARLGAPFEKRRERDASAKIDDDTKCLEKFYIIVAP